MTRTIRRRPRPAELAGAAFAAKALDDPRVGALIEVATRAGMKIDAAAAAVTDAAEEVTAAVAPIRAIIERIEARLEGPSIATRLAVRLAKFLDPPDTPPDATGTTPAAEKPQPSPDAP